MLALVLAAVAGVCLVVGWLLEQIVLVYVALGLSALGLLLVLTAAWRRRQSDGTGSLADNESSTSSVDEVEADDVEIADEEPGSVREVFFERSTGDRLDSDAIVYVLQRRKRFHSAECRLVKGKQAQELTLVEAREAEFTACSVCVGVGAAALLTEQR